uniref:FH2 domain-containing protein n=1 Tax=Monopterus albus TaxID=43700 RepID=A0A3Q3J023_MONAL
TFHSVKGRDNVWTQGQAQQHYQIDVQTVEELFGQNDSQSDSTPTRGGKLRSSFRETREEVSILDTKRGMNIGIFLKQFKRSNQTLVDDIRSGNSEPYGAEPLRELLKMLPETEEVGWLHHSINSKDTQSDHKYTHNDKEGIRNIVQTMMHCYR